MRMREATAESLVGSARAETNGRLVGRYVVRFDVHQRIQHALMILSFIALAGTGLPLRYSEWASSSWWMDRWGGIEVTRAVHRYAAWVMVACCAYHVIYLLVRAISRRSLPTSMLPRRKDLGDFIKDMRHTFGLSKEAPQYDRFSYRNKAAYWLVCIGFIVITVTGFVLMYPVGASGRLGAWAYPLALVIHSDAAILAVGWMLIVHVYFAHFARHIFPMDKGIFTGKVPVERYQREFPLEYERIVAATKVPAEAPADEKRRSAEDGSGRALVTPEET